MDALQHSRRRTKVIASAYGVAIAAGAAWALLPVDVPIAEAPSLVEGGVESPARTELPPLDASAFETPVWTIAATPQPPAPPPPLPPVPPPLKLQLIGILKTDEIYKAVLYDPDTNKIFIVATGQEALGHKIDRVAADTITIKSGTMIRTLALKTGAGGGL